MKTSNRVVTYHKKNPMDKALPIFSAQYFLSLGIALTCVIIFCYSFYRYPKFFQRYDTLMISLLSLIGFSCGLSSTIFEIYWHHLPFVDALPLEICGFSYAILIPWALLSRNMTLQQLLLFWGIMGGTLGLAFPVVTPDINFEYVRYYIAHSSLYLAAAYVLFVHNVPVKRFTFVKIWLLLQLYFVVILIFDLTFKTNYFYLLHKPNQSTPLNEFGPWPYYFIPCEFVAIALFVSINWLSRKLKPQKSTFYAPKIS